MQNSIQRQLNGKGSSLKISRELGGENIDSLIEDALTAERLGFDQVWVPDHLVDINPVFAIYDAWTVLGFLGAKTSALRLGSGVTDIQRMHPAKTANIVATLDNLTKGRAVLGIGAGEIMNTAPYGIPWQEPKERVSRFREYLNVILLLWSSNFYNPVSFEGKYYSLKNAHLSLSPFKKPHPPIYVGSFSSKEMLRIAGEIANGWYPGSLNTPESFQEKANLIKQAEEKAKRPRNSVDIIASIPTFVCNTDEEARIAKREAKDAVKREMLSNQYILRLLHLRLEDILPKSVEEKIEYQHAVPGPRFDKALKDAFESALVPDAVLEKAVENTMAIGSPRECLETITRFVEAGASHIFFSNVGGSSENYRRIGDTVIPKLRSMMS